MKKRVVITGMGVVSPLGNTVSELWDGMKTGKSGIQTIDWLVEAGSNATVGGLIKEDINIDHLVEPKESRRMDPYARYAIHAADEAIKQSGIDFDKTDRERVGVIIGSGIGGLQVFSEEHTKLLQKGHRRVSPFFIPMMIPDIAAGYVSIIWGLKGLNFSVSSACATANHAIGLALRSLRYGDADVVIAGAADATITPIAFAGFANMKALSQNPNPATASRPFDAERSGFVMGEGSGVFVLETLEHAEARGAKILAELSGFWMTGDAYHITSPAPGGEGAVRAIKQALKDADVEPTDIDYINAHGTSTPANDKNETKAIKDVFGDYAYQVNISSTKSMTGHLLGASGGIELAATIMALNDNIVPPTINYQNKDEECDLNYTPNKAKEADLHIAMSNSFGFGGHNAVLVVKKV